MASTVNHQGKRDESSFVSRYAEQRTKGKFRVNCFLKKVTDSMFNTSNKD